MADNDENNDELSQSSEELVNRLKKQIKAQDDYIKNLKKLDHEQKRYGGSLRDVIEKSIKEFDNLQEGTKKYSKEQNRFVNDLKDEFKHLKDAVKDGKKGTEDLWDAAKDLDKAIKAVSNSEDKKIIQDMKMFAARKAAQKESLDSLTTGFTQVTSSLVSGTSGFVKSLQSNSSSTELSAGLMNASIDAAAGAGSTFGKTLEAAGSAIMMAPHPWAKAVGVLVTGAGYLTEMFSDTGAKLAKFGVEIASKEVEKTVKSFNDLSSAGALFANGMTEMRNTAGNAGLTVDQFSTVVKSSTEQLASSGLSVGEASKFTAQVLKSGGKEMKNSLLKLGYGFEEQGQLVADVMKDMRQSSTGPLKATEAQVAEQTQKYAENLRIIAAATGEDAKKKMDQARDTANQLMFQQKLAKMDEVQRENVINAMGNMSGQQQKDFRDMINFGSIINKTGAVMASQNPAYIKSLRESTNAVKNNTLDAKKQRDINSKYNEDIQNGWMKAQGIAAGAAAGIPGMVSDSASSMMEDTNFRRKATKEGYKAAEDSVKNQEDTSDKLTDSVMTAEQAAQDLKLALQKELTPAITDFANISKKMLQGVKDLMKELGLDKKQMASDYRAEQEKLGASPTSNVTGTGPMGAPEIKEAPPEKKEFYNKMYKSLLEEATKAGVKNPEAIARLGAAQSSLETGYGKSHIGEANNYFGIKADKNWQGDSLDKSTQEFENGKMVTKTQKFRKYGSMQESAADYIKFLQSNKRYQGVLSAGSAEEAIAEQAKTGYATDPDYAKKLSNITSRETWQAKEQSKEKAQKESPVSPAKPASVQIPQDKPTTVSTTKEEKPVVPAKPTKPAKSEEELQADRYDAAEQRYAKLMKMEDNNSLSGETYIGRSFNGKHRYRKENGDFAERDDGPSKQQEAAWKVSQEKEELLKSPDMARFKKAANDQYEEKYQRDLEKQRKQQEEIAAQDKELAKVNAQPVNTDNVSTEQQLKNLEQATGKPKSNSDKEAELAKLNAQSVNTDNVSPEQQMKNLEQATGKPKSNPELENQVRGAMQAGAGISFGDQSKVAPPDKDMLIANRESLARDYERKIKTLSANMEGDDSLTDEQKEKGKKAIADYQEKLKATQDELKQIQSGNIVDPATGTPLDTNAKLGQPELQGAQAGMVSTMQQQNEAKDNSRNKSDESLKELVETNKQQLEAAQVQVSHSERTAKYTKDTASTTKSVAIGVNS